MKRLLFLTAVGLFLFGMTGYAQVNTHSLAIVAKISEYQLQLGKLQNTVPQKTNDKQNDSLKAQQSADANARAANSLSANPQDKTDARQADNAASTAKGDSRTARKSTGKLDDTNKKIMDLQNKIADQQMKLSKFTHLPYVPPTPTVVVQSDSSHI
jgi:lipopolysaccharide export LptBFGC system permease protein LptF